jgi:SulP family sulfate permease
MNTSHAFSAPQMKRFFSAAKASFVRQFFPFLSWFPLVNRESLRADFMAGLTGAVIVLPQGVAFATIAGLPPQYGLYTAMVTPVIAAMFGSSRHLISGPTTAISIVVFSSISQYTPVGSPQFVSMALTLTFLAGVYQLAFGLARFGMLVNFVSHTVVIGFTAGAAILIATSQFKYVLGITITRGDSFLHTWVDMLSHIGGTNFYVLIVALVSIATALLVRRRWRRAPHLLAALVAGSVTALLLGGETRGITFVPEIPGTLPPLSMPDFSAASIRRLAPQAFAVALLGLIEAVSIARSVAAKSGQRINGNQEFIGQGMSNIVGSFFSSYAGSGSFTRSGINYEAGARTPMSAIVAALVLMLIVLLVAPLTAYLPVAAMGGVILIVAYNLIDFHQIKHTIQSNRSETAILGITFFSTLFLELEFAIYMGVMLSILFYLARTSKPEIVRLAPDPFDPKRRLISIESMPVAECPQLKIIRIERAVYFGSVDYLQSRLDLMKEREGVNHILIEGTQMNYIDMAGAEMLVQEANRLRAKGGGLYFYGLKPTILTFLAEGKFIRQLGANAFFDSKSEAISAIFRRLDPKVCETCSVRIFKECNPAA